MIDIHVDKAIDLLSQPVYLDEMGELYDTTIFNDYDVEYGATKITIILDDFVLKTSVEGYMINHYVNNEIVRSVKQDFDKDRSNAALVEYKLYLKAIDYGVDQFFAKVEQINDKVFKQEKVDFCFDSFDEVIEEIREDNRKFLGLYSFYELCEQVELLDKLSDYFGPKTALYLFRLYDEESLVRLMNFLAKYDINDLHDGNVGITEEGDFKIFDFSGFGSCTRRLINLE